MNNFQPLLCQVITLHEIEASLINAKDKKAQENHNGSANARCHRSGISQGLKATGAMLIIKQKIIMQMRNDHIIANKMPSRVSEIRVRSCLLGVSSKGVLSVGKIKCETRCCVVVNQVGDVYRRVRSERFVICSVAVTSCVREIV